MAEFVDTETGEVLESASRGELFQLLLEIQAVLKVDKSQFNSYGGFSYRSKEDILEAAKPLAHERGCVLLVDDEVMALPNGRTYIVSTALLVECSTGQSISARGNSREAEVKKGMDESQITGTASSYAGKRALGNLFALDDSKDADGYTDEPVVKLPPQDVSFVGRCQSCGKSYTFNPGTSIQQMNAVGCCARPDWMVV
ncbi:MAG: ERF family protein [Gordonibacter sp.]|uniref:ERF family protein n=2 Tax=Gordonibacter sp. TaxID=1968902 RepID=UPI002FC8E7D8